MTEPFTVVLEALYEGIDGVLCVISSNGMNMELAANASNGQVRAVMNKA